MLDTKFGDRLITGGQSQTVVWKFCLSSHW